jgi:hypothetical protein
MEENRRQKKHYPAQRTDLLGSKLVDRLRKVWRDSADTINGRLARVPRVGIRILLMLLSALFGLYFLGLVIGFL